ncbi:PAS domain-containing protein [Methylobacterium flocculans]|uniref:PAS domain-containing protein n=1 Tax=Methylobacterium flocculans TaxID=2984843 RepID=UPI0021F35477|nr:PAS domain-containing protein [Methylobacterium sp. FF17]
MNQLPPQTREAELEIENAHLRQRVYDAELIAERAMALLNRADEQHRTIEKQLRRSRNDLQSVTDTINQLVWRSGDDGDWTSASPQWTAYTGQSEGQSLGLGWLDTVHPDDRERSLEAWHGALAQGALEIDHRLRRASDGTYRWFQTRATPLRDPSSGRTVEWFGTSTDVHELRAVQERQRLLLGELQHQARNTLAVVRGMARRLAETSRSVDGYAGELDDRLNAFSRVLGTVTRDPGIGVDLEGLVAQEVLAQLANEGEQVEIFGPVILLPSQAAETLGLAIYELASNAAEHGALTKPHGRVKITWTREPSGSGTHLVFVWQETSLVSHIGQPEKRGSGFHFLEQTLVDRLKADVTLTFAPLGVRCTICMPLTKPITPIGR